MKSLFYTILLVLACGSLRAQTLQLDLTLCSDLWCPQAPVTDVQWDLYPGLANPPVSLNEFGTLNGNGCLVIDSAVGNVMSASNYFIVPSKADDPLNGVDIIDLYLIRLHILGIQPLNGPFAEIAADVNNSRSITTFDIVESSKVLMGISPGFPGAPSWRFVDKGYVFPNPNNPFQDIFPQSLTLSADQDSISGEAQFWAVKTGDVNCSAFPGFGGAAEDRGLSALQMPDATLAAGQILELPVYPGQESEWLGFQLSLHADPALLEIEAVLPGALPDVQNFDAARPKPGEWSVLWSGNEPRRIAPDQPLFVLRIRAVQPTNIGKAVSILSDRLPARVYSAEQAYERLTLNFTPADTAFAGIGQARPNPASGEVRIPVRLAESSTIRLDLFDLQGRLILHRSIDADAGIQVIEIPRLQFPSAGWYTWRIQAGSLSGSGKLNIQ